LFDFLLIGLDFNFDFNFGFEPIPNKLRWLCFRFYCFIPLDMLEKVSCLIILSGFDCSKPFTPTFSLSDTYRFSPQSFGP